MSVDNCTALLAYAQNSVYIKFHRNAAVIILVFGERDMCFWLQIIEYKKNKIYF